MAIIFILILMVGANVWWAGAGIVHAEGTGTRMREHLDMQTVRAIDFERVVLSELTRRYGGAKHQLTVRVLFPKQVVEVPKGTLHLEVGEWSGGGRTGRRAFRVGIFVNRQFLKTVNVVGEVKAQIEVMTPIRWLKPKEVVGTEDLSVMMVDVPSLTHDFVLNREEAIGKQVLRPLPPRQPIRKIMLDHPPIIRKGDRVMLEVRIGGLLVQTVGLAKAAGKRGETIPVKNQSSGREVFGTVMASGLVEVGF